MFSATDLKKIFEKPYKRQDWINVLRKNLGVKELYSNPSSVKLKSNVGYKKIATEYFVIGKLITKEGREIGIYEITVNEGVKLERNKVGLRDLLKEVYKIDVDAAFVVFVQDKKWRFSYVSEISRWNKETEKREIKKTDSKRYTYLLGDGERCKTASDRFASISTTDDLFGKGVTLKALEDAFNVETMSKAFFNEYRKQYGYFTKYLTGKDENNKAAGAAHPLLHSPAFKSNEKSARDFIKKMLGRIVFLYFLEKKGWLGVPENGAWGEGDEIFLSNLFNDCNSKETFYPSVLIPLYFKTLNDEKRENELFAIDGSLFTKPGYEKLKIPYLNGGLFDDDEPQTDMVVFPADLFKNLFHFFDQYNFTVYEDSPDEHTVAVDPEMLGHIFENLLEDNKDKGAFYTPKEIVHYMCRESLIEYLYTKLNPQPTESYTELGKQQAAFFGNADKKGQLSLEQKNNTAKELVARTAIEKLVLQHEAADIIEYDEAILKALKEVKICDPAIGSGAFPMGLLMEIFMLVETLFWASRDVASDIWKLNNEWNPAKVKEQIIQNSIYGVDIEKGAVDIARLRFWLSLVVDEESPKPLPNLDYKIVVGNSLLSKFEDKLIDIDWNIHMGKAVEKTKGIIKEQELKLYELQHKQHLYFKQPAVDKRKLQKEIRDLKIIVLVNQLTLSRLKHEEENNVQLSMMATEKELNKREEILEKTRGFNRTINSLEAIKKSKDALLDFFDWKIDFPEVMNKINVAKAHTGFDIVIANPPYGAAVDHNELNLDYTLSKKRLSNTYSYFMEKSLRLTKKNGNITLIVPNTWLSITSTKNLRKVLLVENTVKHLLFTHQIFESMADVPPVVDTVVFTCILKVNNSTSVELITLSENTNIKERLHEVEKRSWPVSRTTQILESNDYKVQLKENVLNAESDVIFLEEKENKKFKVRIGTQEYAVGKGIPALNKESIKKRIYHSNTKIDKSYLPFVPCGDIQPFNFVWSKTYLKWGDNLHCPREKEIYVNEHILVSRIFDKKNKKLKACYIPQGNNSETFVNNTDSFNVLAASKIPYLPLKFLLGLINSKLTGYHLTVSNINLVRKVYPKINTNDLKKIPIPKVVPDIVIEKISSYVDSISRIKQNDPKANTSKIESEIDILIYKLYKLPYEEACIVEGNSEWMSKEAYEKFKIE